MKKFFLILSVVIISLFCFAGCVDADDPNTPEISDMTGGHTHTFNEQKWEYDEDTHWHASTCEHFAERGNEAEHSMKNGECEVCGYSAVGMTVEEFTQNHAETARDFAMLCAEINPQSALAAKISSEFVWFVTDENNKLTAVTYIYTVTGDDGKNQVNIATRSGLNKIDLKEVAAGNVSLQYQDRNLTSRGNEFSYNSNQAEYQALAVKLVDLFAETENYEVSPYSSEPLLRLASVDKIKGEDGFGINVFDFIDTGYARYYVRVTADENASVNDLIGILDTTEKIARHTTQVKEYGALVYKNILN